MFSPGSPDLKVMKDQPKITVGLMDRKAEVSGLLEGNFYPDGAGPLSGRFSAKAEGGKISFLGESHPKIGPSSSVRLKASRGSRFTLHSVTIGNRFHWERKEDQTFQGDLILRIGEGQMMAVINEIPLEDYLSSVISSEMSPASPIEFLKAHSILSRSWLLAHLHRNHRMKERLTPAEKITDGEVIRWYDRGEHNLFDVCADDHCQRYQGITKILSGQAEEAVRETYGQVITCQHKICDARFSKACGGITENFETVWGNRSVPYLKSISDASVPHRPIRTEEEASRWILSKPEAYCHIKEEGLLERILPHVDLQTKDFFRWRVEYSQDELEEILREKSGFDFGSLREILPLQRGPSGRISRLKIVGSKLSMIVGKELEIRRWLSRSHLYSSAFIVRRQGDRLIFHGAGWGHGVGLCQIGAAVMAIRGFLAEGILRHYFTGMEIEKVY